MLLVWKCDDFSKPEKYISQEVAGKYKNIAHIMDVSKKWNSYHLQKQLSLIQILKD